MVADLVNELGESPLGCFRQAFRRDPFVHAETNLAESLDWDAQKEVRDRA
jgi:hypothetical protein